MAKEIVAMILAGGRGSRLYALTQKTAKPAVGFGGKYRIVDFPLSNCVNSNIDTVGIATQYQPHEFTGQTVIEVSVLLFLRIHFLGQCDGIVYRRYAVGFILGESAHSAPCKGKHYKKLFHVD